METESRSEKIHAKGFKMRSSSNTTNYAKIKLGNQVIEDALLPAGRFKKANPRLANKETVNKAIVDGDLNAQREISNFYYQISGIYKRLIRHLSNFYRYDWKATPHVFSDKASNKTIIDNFHKVLYFLDSFQVKKFLGEVSEKVLRDGAYYGYIITNSEGQRQVQELPCTYSRSNYKVNGDWVVEFNMKFFRDMYKNPKLIEQVLSLMPVDFRRGYHLYETGQLKSAIPGESDGWYVLDPNFTVKFNIGDNDYPLFLSVIPHIIDLDEAQALDRKRMAQKLMKIIVQQVPLDKNNDLIFDVDEMQELHDNAVAMLGDSAGVDVLTTFADVKVEDMADRNTTTSTDELEKVERTVYNESGTAQNLFNTDGNIALEKSILDDEASIYGLILQYEAFLNKLIKPFNNSPKKYYYRVEILPTTIYNYKEMAKLYKEQVTLGYSKVLPAIALGQSQSSVLATAEFENNILDLVSIFVPPESSNTRSAVDSDGEKSSGRQEKPDDEKSQKTIANKESMS